MRHSFSNLQRLTIGVQALVLIGAGVPQPVHARPPVVDPPRLERTAARSAPVIARPGQTLPDPPARPRAVTRSVWVTVTAYSSTVDQTDGDPFTTASGEKVRDGIVAWNAVPFGTELRLPSHFGERVFIVQDRLNVQATLYHIDVWMPTREAAVQWGARILKVEVLQPLAQSAPPVA